MSKDGAGYFGSNDIGIRKVLKSTKNFDELKKLGILNSPTENISQNEMHQSKFISRHRKKQISNFTDGILVTNKSHSSMEFLEDESTSQNVSEYEETKNLTQRQNNIGIHRIEGTSVKGKSNIAENMPVIHARDESVNSFNKASAFKSDCYAFPSVSNARSKCSVAPKEERSNLFINTDEQTGEARRGKKSITKETLNDAINDFVVNEDLIPNSDVKDRGNPSELRTNRISFDRNIMFKNYDIKTFEDSLRCFGLTTYLQDLEKSLEDVRRNRKSKADHEDFFNKIDKEIQKLSLIYHPDRVQNNGGTEEDLIIAQKLQTALNATRTVLKFFNSAFIEDIGIDYKFGFYLKLNISSLNNEDQIRQQVYNIVFKIGTISHIKQHNITLEVRKFLIASKNYIHGYLNNKNDFEKYFDTALFHLECCINGFEKLGVELEKLKSQCAEEENGESMDSFIQTMASDSMRDLRLLKLLQTDAKASLKGKLVFFSPEEDMDPYFVLPLVSYTNVMLMCNAVMRGAPRFNIFNLFNSHSKSHPHYRDDLEYLMQPYYLASYFSGNKYHEETAWEIVDKMKLVPKGYLFQLSKEDIKSAFYVSIKQINEIMESKFKVNDYNEVNTTNILMADLEKCKAMMSEFKNLEKELSKDIEDFRKQMKEMDEIYASVDEGNKETVDMNFKIREALEQNETINEKFSSIFF